MYERMIQEEDDLGYGYKAKRRARPGEFKSWLVCAVFGAAIGYAAAANFGEAIDAASDFLSAPDRARAAREAAMRPAAPVPAPAALPANYLTARLSVSERVSLVDAVGGR